MTAADVAWPIAAVVSFLAIAASGVVLTVRWLESASDERVTMLRAQISESERIHAADLAELRRQNVAKIQHLEWEGVARATDHERASHAALAGLQREKDAELERRAGQLADHAAKIEERDRKIAELEAQLSFAEAQRPGLLPRFG